MSTIVGQITFAQDSVECFLDITAGGEVPGIRTYNQIIPDLVLAVCVQHDIQTFFCLRIQRDHPVTPGILGRCNDLRVVLCNAGVPILDVAYRLRDMDAGSILRVFQYSFAGESKKLALSQPGIQNEHQCGTVAVIQSAVRSLGKRNLLYCLSGFFR